MTEKEAYKILGLPPGTAMEETKKRYHQLIMQVHPDINTPSKQAYAYNAQEINLAFSFLKKRNFTRMEPPSPNQPKTASKAQKHAAWDAPVNENAYMEREILHYAEDYDGKVLGNFCIAKGKYLWKTEEDFPLFLLSLYRCSKYLLDATESGFPGKESPLPIIRQQFQAEITYLLAQQFIDAASLLKELTKEKSIDADGSKIFYISSMLEPSNPSITLKAGESLFPSGIRKHRLYLKTQSGKEIGYLSFPDDRLYYIVVPLLEQKQVQVRVKVAEKQNEKKRKTPINYQRLHLWIKFSDIVPNFLPENLNLQIGQLLEQYMRLT